MLTGLLWKHDIYFSPQKQDSYTSCTPASGWCITDAELTPFSPPLSNMSTEFFSEAEIIQSNQRNSPSALVPDVCLDSHWQFVCMRECLDVWILCASPWDLSASAVEQRQTAGVRLWFALILRWADVALLKPYQIQKLLFCIFHIIHHTSDSFMKPGTMGEGFG